MTDDREMREDETFAQWQFRVKPFLTARNKWIDENIKYIPGPIQFNKGRDMAKSELPPLVARLEADVTPFRESLFRVAEALIDAANNIENGTPSDPETCDAQCDVNVCAEAPRQPLGELDVMESLVGLFADLNPGARARVWRWAADRFNVAV